MDRGLIPFLQQIRTLGLSIKLDTNGLFPRVVSECIKENLVDYVAVDVKTSPEKFSSLTGKDISFSDILCTIDILENSAIDHEIRTTCVPGFVTIEDIKIIGESTGRVKKYFLQQFVNTALLLDSSIKKLPPYPVVYLYDLQKEVLKFSDFCLIRGI